MNARRFLFLAAVGGALLAGCAGEGYVEDDGPAYAGPGFYGDVWYDSGPYYVHPPYGHGDWDRDHHWHDAGPPPRDRDEHRGPGEQHPPAGRPAPRPVPSVPNAPRPDRGHDRDDHRDGRDRHDR